MVSGSTAPVKPRQEWRVSLDQYLAWMKVQHEAGKILFSGPTTDRKYGIHAIWATSREQAEKNRRQRPVHGGRFYSI